LDKIGLVSFNSIATPYKTELVDATEDNKKDIISYLDNLDSSGPTNYYDAFLKAFDILDQNYEKDPINFQNTLTAILFLTDGVIDEQD
jgi:Mg-chelatase subunit ChlD